MQGRNAETRLCVGRTKGGCANGPMETPESSCARKLPANE